jgi:hypothetical protein
VEIYSASRPALLEFGAENGGKAGLCYRFEATPKRRFFLVREQSELCLVKAMIFGFRRMPNRTYWAKVDPRTIIEDSPLTCQEVSA